MELKKKKYYQKLFVLVLSFALIVQNICLPNEAKAASNTEGDYTFEIKSDNTATITGFSNTTATKVKIPNNFGGIRVTEIANYAFVRKMNIQELVIPDTVTKIGDSAFYYNTSIKNLVIPGSVKYIGTNAFANCTSLEKLTILHGVETISRGAFANCTKLSNVEIGPSVNEMQGSTFQKVQGMTLVAEPNSPAASYSGDGSTTVTHKKPADDSAVVYAYETAADGTVVIKEYVGSSATPQVPATINGNKVTGLGNGAFHKKPVNSVTLPDSIKTLGDDVFTGTNITELILPGGITSIGENLIDNKGGIIIKSDSPYVEEYISKYFTNVRFEPYKVTMSSYHKVTFITNGYGKITLGTNGYYKDGYKISINAAPYRGYEFDSWTVSGLGAFEDATKSDTIFTMSSTPVTIKANFVMAKRPDVIYKDGKFLEYNISGDLVIEETYRKSEEDATLVPTTEIAANAFSHYVSEHGRWYYGYPTTVSLPTSMAIIPTGIFNSCNTLKEITVKEPNSNFTSKDGVLFNEDMTVLLAYPRAKTDKTYIMPNTVEEIAPYAFYCNSYLENITFSNKLKTIGAESFYNAGSLKEVDLPSSVVTIGSNAFMSNDSLKNVKIKAAVTSIGALAFNSCSSLEKIEVEENNVRYKAVSGVLFDKVSNELLLYPSKKSGEQYSIPTGTEIIGSYAFDMSSLKTIEIPNDVVSLKSYAFKACTRLESITIPSSIKTLPYGVLYNCNSLKNIQLPLGLESIESDAFWYCRSLTSIEIPSSVTSIADGIFYNCTKLESIQVNNENTKYMDENGILYTSDKTKLICYPAAKQIETNTYVVAAGTKNISEYAFAYTALKEVDLLDSVTSIGYEAFTYCSNLTNVTMRNKEMYINGNPFWGTNTSNLVITGYFKSTAEMYALNYGIRFLQIDDVTKEFIINPAGEVIGYTGNEQQITIPSAIEDPNKGIISVTSIGKNAFKNPNNPESKVYEQITKINMPYSIKTIKEFAFDGCKNLTDEGLELPLGLTSIGTSAFNNCTSLTKVTIPAKVSSIKTSAFDGCTSLSQILVDSSNEYFTNIDGVLTNKDKSMIARVPIAFTGNNGLYEIPDKVTSMMSGSMEGCTSINKIAIKNLLYIGQAAFKGAFTSKVEIDLSNVDDIDNNAFEGCTGITTITIPSSVTRLGDNVFYGCDNLEEILVKAENTIYTDVDGVLFNKDMTALVVYPAGKQITTYSIPDGVKQIYDNAFYAASKLTAINMPNTVLNIGNGAFSKGQFLTINLSKSLETIGNSAFADSEKLMEITIPSHVQSIGESAFSGCPKLANVYVYSKDIKYNQEGDVFNQGLVDQPLLKLHGYAGSTTEKYAEEKNIPFILLQAGDVNIETFRQTISDANMIYNAAMEGMEQGQYAIGSKAAFKAAIVIAERIAENQSSQEAIAAAMTDLQNAMRTFAAAMVPYAADKSQLLSLCIEVESIYSNAVEGIEAGQYPVGSKAILFTSLNQSQATLANMNVSQGDVDLSFMELQSALVDFQKVRVTNSDIIYGELLAGVSIAQAKYNAAIEGTEIGSYAAGSKAIYWSAIQSAKGLLQNLNTNALQYTVNPTSYSAVNMPIMNTSPVAVNFDLRSNVTQDQVNEGVRELVRAGIAFENAKNRPENLVNTSSIKMLIAYTEGLYSNAVEGTEAGNYPVGKKAELRAAIDRAYAVLNLSNPLQSEIDHQFNTLQQAINIFEASKVTENITPSPEKVVLSERLQTAVSAIESGLYTQSSIDVLTTAMIYGRSVYNNSNATENQITIAINRLDAAIGGLVLK